MSTEGRIPAAMAWTYWARPISKPSAVMAEFSAMFWDLKGATRYPSWAKIRHRPAQSRLFPALEAVPWIIMALAIYSTSFSAYSSLSFSRPVRTQTL